MIDGCCVLCVARCTSHVLCLSLKNTRLYTHTLEFLFENITVLLLKHDLMSPFFFSVFLGGKQM